MPEPVTSSLIFMGSAVVSGVLGNRSDAGFKARWDKFRRKLAEYRPYANHELARAAYRAYLQATLQSCAALLQQNNLNVETWFKFGILPEKMAVAFRSLLSDTPAGVFTQANKQWLAAVSQDHLDKLKLLDKEKLDPPFEYEHEEFAELLKEIELLMQPEEARNREKSIREALATRVLRDLESQFGEAPEDFTLLVNERWFEFLCAGFQYCIKHHQEIANAFESRLLAKLVVRSDWQHQLTDFGGESLKKIEAAHEWLRQEQHEGFERIESLVTLLLPLLSFASDEAARNETLTLLIRAESDRVIDVVQDESDKSRAHADQHFRDLKATIEERVQQPSDTPEPLIHTLPTHQDIEGREEECEVILRAMSTSEERVLVFAAPGGFGKTALLAKLIQKISADGKTFLDSVSLPNGETVETRITALLHVDCRNELNLSTLFANAGRLEGDKAIEIRERLVNVEKQAHLANALAMAYTNKGVALRGLTRLTEAVAEYDKAIDIRERLVNVEKQAHLANDMAMAYMNKGVALDSLTRLTEAMAECDKAIEIRERLVNVEKQAHLANELAGAYMNKALGLEKQEDWDRALACYENSLQARTFCVDQLRMFWIMPQLLTTLRYRLMTLLDLQRWALAAQDVLRFLSFYKPYAVSETIDDGLKKAAGEEFTQMTASLRALTTEQCELLYAELGDEAEEVRSFVSGSVND